jgi:predicted GNAT family acetyltransferase
MSRAGGAPGQRVDGQPARSASTQRAAAPLRVERFAAVEAFLGVAGDFLGDREAEHNLILGLCHNMLTSPSLYPTPHLAAVINRDEEVVACTIQTPPWQLVLSEVDDSRAVQLLVEDRLDDPPPGVLGPTDAAAAYARLMADRTGRAARLATGERIFRLENLVPPRRANGAMRPARPSDRALLVQWLTEFIDEALGDAHHDDIEALADRYATGEGRVMQLWLDNGLPVSMCGVGSPTPHGIRIGPVYTPSDLRNRGYASNLVARACANELNAGRRYCFLFTDRSNPTSNHIYQEIGFEAVTDVDRWTID